MGVGFGTHSPRTLQMKRPARGDEVGSKRQRVAKPWCRARIRGLWKVVLCVHLFKKSRPVDLQNTPGVFPSDPSYHRGVLKNGMQYFIKKNATPKHRAELRLVVKVGSLQEEDDQQGLAHFLEHCAFRQTRNFRDGEIIKYLESCGMAFGADLNASTTFDHTVYQLTVPTNPEKSTVLTQAFQIMADWARGIQPNKESLENEKKVVLEEWRESQGSCHRLFLQSFSRKTKGSRFPSRMPIGSFEVLDAVDEEKLLSFYNKWYRPEFMAIVAVGDFQNFAQVIIVLTQSLNV